MPNLNYFRGSPGGTGVPAGWGQATNTGAAAGISKGMDALAKGLEKFFQNKKEQAEEDAYAELLEKLNELPGKTKEVGRKTAEQVAGETPGLPDFLDTAMGQVPGSEFTGPMPVDPSSIVPPEDYESYPQLISQEQIPNPRTAAADKYRAIFEGDDYSTGFITDGMLYDPESGEYYPLSALPPGAKNPPGYGNEFETITYPGPTTRYDGYQPVQDNITEHVVGHPPIPQTIPGPVTQTPVLPPQQAMQRPMPDYRATEAGMAGQQVPLSFGEQDQARQQLIAEYTRRIGTDRAEKLMGEQFKTHRDEAGDPIAYSYGKSFQLAPKTDPTFTEKDFIEFEVGGVKGVMNRRNGTIKLPTQEGALEEGITALKQMKEMNRSSLVALKEAGTTHVYFDPEDKVFKDAELDPSTWKKHPTIDIEKAIAAQTTEGDSKGKAKAFLNSK